MKAVYVHFFGVNIHYFSSARVLTIRQWIFYYFIFRDF